MEQERNLGQQALAQLMADHQLKPADLVRASTLQLTHKTVTRAVKGRRLTANSMRKVLRALNTASGKTYGIEELFNYKPSPRPPAGPSPNE